MYRGLSNPVIEVTLLGLRQAAALVANIALLLLASGCVNQIFLHPEIARAAAAKHPTNPGLYGDHPEQVIVTNRSGAKLNGWCFYEPTNHGVVLVGDGNATALPHTYEYNRYLLHHGFNVVILSYQGFGANEGEADLDSLLGDVAAFYEFCRAKFPGQPIAFVAQSVSTDPFFCFASRHPEVAGMALEAMVDLKTVAWSTVIDWWGLYPIFPITFPAAGLACARVPGELSISKALERHPQMPALFIHHPADRVTPYRAARRMYAKYEGPKEFIDLRADRTGEFHMTGAYEAEIRARILAFIQDAMKRTVR
jgi:pimeloyl-ACP methyl ester carboxylesterase